MPTSVRLPEEAEQRLTALAENTGRSKAYYIREALLEHLDDLEDFYLAEMRLKELKAGRSRTYTLEEVGRELGLED